MGHSLRGHKIFDKQVDKAGEKIEIAHIYGAGNKCLHIACRNIDSYLSAYLEFWDLCGGDVILRAQGCNSTDKNGKLLKYIEHPKYKTMLRTALFTLNKNFYEAHDALLNFAEF